MGFKVSQLDYIMQNNRKKAELDEIVHIQQKNPFGVLLVNLIY